MDMHVKNEDVNEECNCINCRLQRIEIRLDSLINKVEKESALYEK